MNTLFNEVQINDDKLTSIAPNMRGTTVSVTSYGQLGRKLVGDAQLHDANFAFLSSELAKLINTPVEPLANTTYAKDIPTDIGGGFVDYVRYFTISYSGIANAYRNVVGNGVNSIPRVNAGLSQNNAMVYTFELAYDIRFVELEKLNKLTLPKDLETIYKEAIMVSWNYYVQEVAYLGGGDANHYGLFNHTDIVPTNVTNISKAGVLDLSVSDTELAGLINGIIAQFLSNSGMNTYALPDTFLVPTWFGQALTGRFSNLYEKSLRNYITEHNLAVDEGALKITIESRPQLDTLGAAGAGRIVSYKKDKKFVRLDIPYQMQHYITLPNIDKMAYTSAFVGQVSEIILPYNTSNTDKAAPVQYWDFIA